MLSTIPPNPLPPFFPPPPPAEPSHHAAPQLPIVFVPPVWEYRQLSRKLGAEPLPNAEDLDAMGKHGWELVAVVSEPTQVHFYFKRQRD